MGLGAAIGALIGMAAGAAGFTIAGISAGLMWAVGASVGSLFDKPKISGFSQESPTYSFGPISNPRSQLLPVPIIYGRARVAGNIFMQRFHDSKKTTQDLFVGVGLGEISAIRNIQANDIPLYSAAEIEAGTSRKYFVTRKIYDGANKNGVPKYKYVEYQTNKENYEASTLPVKLENEWFPSGTGYKRIETKYSIANPAGCSINTYLGTYNQRADSRSPGGLSYPNTAYIALTLKANENLSGNPTITSIVEGRKIWTPEGTRFSRNPAWIIYDFLTGKYYEPKTGTYEPVGLGWPKEFCDLNSFKAAAAYCDELVWGDQPRFQLDYVIDSQRQAVDILSDMLSCFRGALIAREKVSLVIDKPVTTPHKAVGPDNIIEGSFTWWKRPYDEIFNRVIVEWIDPNNSWERTVSLFEDVADIKKRGIVEQTYSLLGITSPAIAQRMGAYLIDIANGSRNLCSFAVSLKDADIEAGDVIALTHDLAGWVGKWFRVLKVEDQPDDTFILTCAEYVPTAYDDRALNIDLAIDTELDNPFEAGKVSNIRATEWGYKLKDGTHVANVDLAWDQPTTGAETSGYKVFATYADGVRRLAASPSGNACTLKNIPTGEQIKIEVVNITIIGAESEPVFIYFTAIGKDEAPPKVENFVVLQRGNKVVLDGDIPKMPDFKCLEVRHGGSSWKQAKYIGRFESFPIEIGGFLDGTRIFRVKMIDNGGQESLADTSYIANIIGVNENLNTILEKDDIAEGVLSSENIFVRSDGVLVSRGTVTYSDLPGTYAELAEENYPTLAGDGALVVLSNIVDTFKIGRTGIHYDFISDSILNEFATYGEIGSRTYGEYPYDTYENITITAIEKIENRFSDDNVVWGNWEKYVAGEKEFRYVQYRYSLRFDDVPIRTIITQLAQIYDVPDIEIIETLEIPVGGLVVNFAAYGADFYQIPREITPVVQNGGGNIFPDVTNVSTESVKITCYDRTGASVAGTVLLTVRGY